MPALTHTALTHTELVSRIRSIDAGPMPVYDGKPLLVANPVEDCGWPRATIEYRGYGKWAISYAPDVLSKAGKFIYEPLPSSRGDAFLERTRFASIEEAYEFWTLWDAFVRERFAAGHVWGTTSWTSYDDRLCRKVVT